MDGLKGVRSALSEVLSGHSRDPLTIYTSKLNNIMWGRKDYV